MGRPPIKKIQKEKEVTPKAQQETKNNTVGIANKENINEIIEEAAEQAKEISEQQPPRIIITDVRPFPQSRDDDTPRAWFKGETEMISMPIDFTGTIIDLDATDERISSVLVTMQNGILNAPILIPGFIGLFPKDQLFEEDGTEIPESDDEEFPPFPEGEEVEEIPEIIDVTEKTPDVKPLPDIETPSITQPESQIEAIAAATPQDAVVKHIEKKMGLLDRLRKKQQPARTDNTDLLKTLVENSK